MPPSTPLLTPLSAPGPRRDLGALTCLALGLTTIVGSGIFALPPQLAASLGPLSFLAFLGAAAVISLIGLMTAEAAGTTDRAGGPYQGPRSASAPAGSPG
jgi:amino acid transporter